MSLKTDCFCHAVAADFLVISDYSVSMFMLMYLCVMSALVGLVRSDISRKNTHECVALVKEDLPRKWEGIFGGRFS